MIDQGPSTIQPCATLVAAMASGPDALFTLPAERARIIMGEVLLTVLVPNREDTRLVRIYSSDERRYPLEEAHHVEDSRWFRQIFAERRPVIANDEEEIAAWHPGFGGDGKSDHGALANLPVIAGGQVLGIVNLMSPTRRFTERRLRDLQAELPAAALGVMIADRFRHDI